VKLRCGRFALSLDRPLVMGVVNVTPDSFSDGGRYVEPKAAVAHARKLIEQGADLVDIGGESSRPGAAPVTESEELQRILPVLRGLQDLEKPISVDTRRPAVMRAALESGASMINDIDALTAPGALAAVAGGDCAICLMHKKGDPATMQKDPQYHDVVGDVKTFLNDRVKAAISSGIDSRRLVVDPGFGFGKTVTHNLMLLGGLKEIRSLKLPVLVGFSRKSTLGAITGRPADERLAGSLAMVLLALQAGATMLRVHDVKETRDVIAIWQAYVSEGQT